MHIWFVLLQKEHFHAEHSRQLWRTCVCPYVELRQRLQLQTEAAVQAAITNHTLMVNDSKKSNKKPHIYQQTYPYQELKRSDKHSFTASFYRIKYKFLHAFGIWFYRFLYIYNSEKHIKGRSHLRHLDDFTMRLVRNVQFSRQPIKLLPEWKSSHQKGSFSTCRCVFPFMEGNWARKLINCSQS